LAAGGTRGGCERRQRDVSGRGKANGSGKRRPGELEGQVVGLERRGVAAAWELAGEGRRAVEPSSREKQRGRGERKTMRISP
jgi:hypothetical protein